MFGPAEADKASDARNDENVNIKQDDASIISLPEKPPTRESEPPAPAPPGPPPAGLPQLAEEDSSEIGDWKVSSSVLIERDMERLLDIETSLHRVDEESIAESVPAEKPTEQDRSASDTPRPPPRTLNVPEIARSEAPDDGSFHSVPLPRSSTPRESASDIQSNSNLAPPSSVRASLSVGDLSRRAADQGPLRDIRKEKRKDSTGDRADVESSLASATSTLRIGTATSRHTLTLKEQNSNIDKLTKENFDLKLKIHFLDQALQRRSEEGLGELVQENVQLQTDLANERKESLVLRRRAREAERKSRIMEEELRELKASMASRETENSLKEEVRYLRDQVEQSELVTHQLRTELLEHEVAKRRMAETVRLMQGGGGGDRNDRDAKGVEEAMEMWKDLLAAETARREQADEDAGRLRMEISRLQESTKYGGRTTVDTDDDTVVSKLQHENAELRRDLGAQTSMLTSRNRERERLQAEIEELKLASRRGGTGGMSIAGDSIFERSVSRAGRGQHHSNSGANMVGNSVAGSMAVMNELEQERDELEQRLAAVRDEAAQLRLLNQDLERELNEHLDLLQRIEADRDEIAQDRDGVIHDRDEIARQRDEILQEREELLAAIAEHEEESHRLQNEALNTIEKLEAEVRQKGDDYDSLRAEMDSLTRTILGLEDEKADSRARLQSMDAELDAANAELEGLDKQVSELSQKVERLEVQLESHQAEIGFLREEQEADKIKIGSLEASLEGEKGVVEEKRKEIAEKQQEVEKRQTIIDEKVAGLEAAQKTIEDTRSQLQERHEQVERAREDATSWQNVFMELQDSLRSIVGEGGDLIKDVTDMKEALNEQTRMVRDRDELVERAGLDLQSTSASLEKEKRALQQTRIRLDQLTTQNQTYSETIRAHESRIRKLDTTQKRDRDHIASLETQLQAKHTSQTALLLNLWHRLSSLCGTDWAQKNTLIDGQALPTVESIARNLPGFSKNILLAIKTIERMVKGFRERLQTIERDLWKDYQTLEKAIDARSQKLDRLELTVNSLQFVPQPLRNRGSPTPGGSNGTTEAALRRENLMLHARLAELQQQAQQHNTNSSSTSPDFRRSRIPTATAGAAAAAAGALSQRSSKRSNNPSYSVVGSPLTFDPTTTVPGHQSRPSIDYSSTNPPPGTPTTGAGSGGATPASASASDGYGGNMVAGGPAGSVGSGQMSQAEIAKAVLCHEFLQQAKEERGLRAQERSNARRRLLEKEGR